MIFDYDNIPFEEFPNFKGGECVMKAKMYFDSDCRFFRAVLHPGASIGMHCHTDSCEAIYILKGAGKALLEGGESEAVSAGQCHYCPRGCSHSLVNTGTDDLEFFAVVSNCQPLQK